VSRVCTIVAPLGAILLLVGCGDSLKSKDKVQSAIMERLQSKTGLDMNELDVSTTDVSFNKDMAYATVAIHPKGDSNVKHGMSMKYTLIEREGKWVVVNAGGPKLGGPAPKSADGANLPPGHPALPSEPTMVPGSLAPDSSSALPDKRPTPPQKGPNQ
jgi:hypothetical protein